MSQNQDLTQEHFLILDQVRDLLLSEGAPAVRQIGELEESASNCSEVRVQGWSGQWYLLQVIEE